MTNLQAARRREVHYRGRVQGVGFRYTARAVAQRYNVTGYVRNLPDGRVELVVEGPPDELDKMLSEVAGSMGRHITAVDSREGPAAGGFDQFDIQLY